jgi:long-chain acyl-CoA synthetase
MEDQTLVHILDKFRQRGAETAFVCRRGHRSFRWTYGQVADAAWRLAEELQRRNIHAGEHAILWGADCAEWVVSFFACVLCGIVIVPMDRAASPEFVRRVCDQVDPKICIGSHEQPRIYPALPFIAFDGVPALSSTRATPRLDLPDLKGEDPVEIVFTSGTTAEPKGVILSHQNILANLIPLELEISKYLKYERIVHPVRFLNLLPLSHVFGQFLGIFIPQILGGAVIFQNTLNPSEIIRTVKKERVSVLVTVPRILETLQNKIERDLEASGRLNEFRRHMDQSEGRHFLRRWWLFRHIHRQFGWKFWAFISGGASLKPETEQFWGCLGFAVVQGYGLTETTSMISLNHPFKIGRGSIGKVLPGREIKLAPDGEILVRGASIAKNYFQGRDLKPVAGEEAWFHTGDVGMLDENGNLYFKGRRKNVIVSPEGMNIYPEDLEIALRQQPEIRDCVVLGWERGGNAEPCAVLLMRRKDQDPAAVIQRANATLAEFQRMRHWLVWPDDDFPRTSTQKPQTNSIRQYVNAQLSGSGIAASGGETVADLIARITGRKPGLMSPEISLSKDLSLSSIERVELLSALEDRFQIDLDESRFTSAMTVGDLTRMLTEPALQQTAFHYPRWAQRAPFVILRTLVYYLLTLPITLLMDWPRIRGRENFGNLRGPILVVANHITQADAVFILAALPMRYRHRLAIAMAGEMLCQMRNPPKEMPAIGRFREKLSYWLVVSLFNVFPLPQNAGFRESFAFAGECVDRGASILVFPEGKRTLDGNLSPFRAGIGLLANNLHIPVVPIKIDGLYELRKTGKIFSKPGTVQVTIGTPLRFEHGADPATITRELESCFPTHWKSVPASF